MQVVLGIDAAWTANNPIEMARPLIDAEGHELNVELAATPIAVEGDPVRMTQILGNLLNNAAKYPDKGGRICIHAASDEPEVRIRIQDNVIGMTLQTRARQKACH